MATSRTITTSQVALLLAFFCCAPLHAQTSNQVQPVKRHPGAGYNPFSAAQIQIARLRQTAGQLRLLANQPVPPNLSVNARAEFAQHQQWLSQAEQRISVLADRWEDQFKSLGDKNALDPAISINSFFDAQSATLQTKLRRESLAQTSELERVRSSGATARLAIGKMY